MNATAVHEFLELTEKKKRVQAELDQISAAVRDAEKGLLEEFERDGINSVKADGSTVYIHRQTWAKPKNNDHEATAAVLKQAGFDGLVKFSVNTHTLSAFVREQEAAGTALPVAVADAIEVSEVYSIRARKGN